MRCQILNKPTFKLKKCNFEAEIFKRGLHVYVLSDEMVFLRLFIKVKTTLQVFVSITMFKHDILRNQNNEKRNKTHTETYTD